MSLSLSLGLGGAGGFTPGLNAYWGQAGGRSLREVCDSGVNYATVSFINNSPEHGNGYPGSNFGANCGGKYYTKDGKLTKLLSGCTSIQDDIPYCQSKGVKVLLAIGGQAMPGNSEYDVSSVAEGIKFAKFMYNAFGPYNSSWDGPRPFDKGPGQEVSIDGFDLDLEDKSKRFSNEPYIAMVEWWRKQSKRMIVTAAPECFISTPWFKNKNDELIAKAEFDALFIQFYNNPVCDAIPGNMPDDKFSFDAWADKVAGGKSANAKLFIGLPASKDSAGSGYIDSKAMKKLVCKYSSYINFGGVSLWDATRAMDNPVGQGKNFLQSAVENVKYLCEEPPVTTSSVSTSTKATSTTVSSASSVKPKTSSASPVKPKTSSASPVKPTTSSASPVKPTTSSASPIKPTAINSTSSEKSSSLWPNSMTTNTLQTTSKPVSLTTSTVYTTSVHTITECPPTVTDCPVGHVTTETIALYTTVCPVTETAHPPKPTTTRAPVLTTSTVYTTSVHTITECPPTVIDCPVGHVTTETIALYTTVCPVTETAHPPKPTTTRAPVLTTSTVYTTSVHTITECPPTVIDCPVGHVTTETIALYTTVCPVTEIAHPPQPTTTKAPITETAHPPKPTTTKAPITETAHPPKPTTTKAPVTETTHSPKPTTTKALVTETTHSPKPTTTKAPVMTTSTVYTTSVHTVTDCPPAVTDCPVGHVTTETFALYTTVCPVTETAHPPKPTTIKAPVTETAHPPQPTTTKAPVMTTSTVYTTSVHTVTDCPPAVTDCPVGHVTTETIALYTTVCPVGEAETAKVPKPTGSAPLTGSSPLTAVTQTTTFTKTVKVQRPSSVQTLIRSSAGAPQPSGKDCTGPSCPGASNAPGSDCTGAQCPGVATPTNSWSNKHVDGTGCTGTECPGVALPTNAWTSSPVRHSVVPSSPVTAGASTLALGLTGLVAIVAAQVLAM